MPEMSGFEATKYIREKMNSQIPIIALTADVTTVDLEKCKVVGMNDYISKPVDERALYIKIVDLFKKTVNLRDNNDMDKKEEEEKQTSLTTGSSKCIDLNYLFKHTKANPELMIEMIAIYLEQTPPLIIKMKQSLKDKDWDTLRTTAHKIIPSFSIMGIQKKFEDIAKNIQEYARTKQNLSEVEGLIAQLENVCSQACEELKGEYNLIKKTIK
jgi:CheY-like chemotaxis protein